MLKLSTDRKTSPLIMGTEKSPRPLANAFGLPAGQNGSCPGATEVCSTVCYAGKLEKIYKGSSNLVNANFDALKGKSVVEMAELLSPIVRAFAAEADKRGAEKIFRIHWDGDLFSRDYADAWASIAFQYADVHFWIYTRSFDYVDAFVDVPNMSVYLSVDTANFRQAKETLKGRPWLKVAILAVNENAARALHNSLMRPTAIRCPENAGKLPLIVDVKGTRKGACAACGLCVKGRRDVLFSSGR